MYCIMFYLIIKIFLLDTNIVTYTINIFLLIPKKLMMDILIGCLILHQTYLAMLKYQLFLLTILK